MRFVIIYQNREDVRNNVEALINQAIAQGANLAAQEIQHPLVQTKLYWPDVKFVNSLPLNVQCEEVEFKEGKLISLKKSIVDIEVSVSENKG